MLFRSEQLLLEPMFEVPGSDITKVVIEEDTARGYHPAHYQYKNQNQDELNKPEQPDETSSEVVERSEIKTSVL